MVVLEKLTSRKGAQIQFHFEDENDMGLLQKEYSRRNLQNQTRDLIDRNGVDTGKGTVIHMLMNSQGNGTPMTEAEYAEWQAKEEKDWFHKRRRRHPLGGIDIIMTLALLDDLFSGHSGFGMPMGMRMMEGLPFSLENEFVGPTDEEMEEILSDPESMKKILAVVEEKEGPHDCRLCVVPTILCPGRHDSYDHEALKEALKALKESPAE